MSKYTPEEIALWHAGKACEVLDDATSSPVVNIDEAWMYARAQAHAAISVAFSTIARNERDAPPELIDRIHHFSVADDQCLGGPVESADWGRVTCSRCRLVRTRALRKTCGLDCPMMAGHEGACMPYRDAYE